MADVESDIEDGFDQGSLPEVLRPPTLPVVPVFPPLAPAATLTAQPEAYVKRFIADIDSWGDVGATERKITAVCDRLTAMLSEWKPTVAPPPPPTPAFVLPSALPPQTPVLPQPAPGRLQAHHRSASLASAVSATAKPVPAVTSVRSTAGTPAPSVSSQNFTRSTASRDAKKVHAQSDGTPRQSAISVKSAPSGLTSRATSMRAASDPLKPKSSTKSRGYLDIALASIEMAQKLKAATPR